MLWGSEIVGAMLLRSPGKLMEALRWTARLAALMQPQAERAEMHSQLAAQMKPQALGQKSLAKTGVERSAVQAGEPRHRRD